MTLNNLLGVMYDDQARRLSRTTDPDTSKEAAESVVPNLTKLQALVLEYAISCGEFGFTDPELNEAMGPICEGHNHGTSTWRSRRAELVRKGKIEDSGKRHKRASGRNHIVWRVVKDV